MPELAPAYPRNILDEDRQGVLGRPLSRIDGPLKVSGRATYAYEHEGAGKVAYGFIVGAGVSNGRVVSIDTEEAKAVPGVLLIMTQANAPKQAAYVTADRLAEVGALFPYSVARPF